MRILLTDDERMVRLGMISMLDELYPNQHTYMEARNGKEMLEIVGDFRPDIAFIDIRMPLMSGLDALERCVKLCPDTQYLILSGHSDFEYARTGMRCGATDYLLKPVSLDTLRKSMEAAIRGIEKNIRNECMIFSHYVSELYRDGPSGAAIPMKGDGTVRVVMGVVDHHDPEVKKNTYQELADAIREQLEARLDSSFRFALFYTRIGRLCLVLDGPVHGIRSMVVELSAGIHRSITWSDADHIALGELNAYCDRISKVLAARNLFGCDGFYGWDTAVEERARRLGALSAELHALCNAFTAGNEFEFKNVLNGLKESRRHREADYRLADRESVTRYFAAAMGWNEIDATDLSTLLASLGAHVEQIHQAQEKKIELIDWVTDYIQENYMKDIGIKSIADLLGISPNYLSKIFHERVGQKFIDYLTEVRVTNAKRLFAQNREVTVKRVAEMVGYISTRHFTKTFCRVVGMLPSEYQSSQK